MNLKRYTVAGFVWLGLEFNGTLYLIHKLGRVGDCIPNC